MPFTYELLSRQDDETSGAIIKALSGDAAFRQLSASEGKSIQQRDGEDDVKLAVGINVSIKKGIIPQDPNVAEVHKVSVGGKSADEVAQEILGQLPGESGNVIILQGLSGTGKGTTVNKLKALLPKCITWSNGNIFRSITHIVSEEVGEAEFSTASLTPEVIAAAVKRLEFRRFDDGFDVIIDGTTRVRDVQNTMLKRPIISSRVPTVAEQTQGEVIKFGAAAVAMLTAEGFNVVLEGRAQTLNYIESRSRFELTMNDVQILGQRRAAQRVMAEALAGLTKESSPADVEKAVTSASTGLN